MKKAFLEKKKKIRGFATIALLGCVGVAALALAIYSLATGGFFFALAYIVALLLSLVYTVMKINTVIPTFIACDEENIQLCVWENDFFPYKPDRGFIGEFIPEKVKTTDIAMDEVKSIFIGSGNFIVRNYASTAFAEKFKEYKARFASVVKRMEFILIVLKDGSEHYMPVTDFDPEALAGIVKACRQVNPMLEFVTGNRQVRKFVPKQEMKF